MKTKPARPQYIKVGGKRLVVLEQSDYERLARKAEEWEPALPAPNARGNYPLEALAIVLARDILRARRQLGLTQAELARRAGIRPETLNRIEQGKHKPSVATVEKIDRALKAADRQSSGNARSKGKRQQP